MVKGPQRSSKFLKVPQRSSKVLNGLQQPSKALNDSQRSSKVLKDPKRFSKVLKFTERSSKVFKGSQKYSRYSKVFEVEKCLISYNCGTLHHRLGISLFYVNLHKTFLSSRDLKSFFSYLTVFYS